MWIIDCETLYRIGQHCSKIVTYPDVGVHVSYNLEHQPDFSVTV